ncbi:MAG: polymerase, sigma-24 subunit, subfamily [Phycisphaerales bacterium]|nr:polymerase, sigma-24 subunit, subfamily [Phycisphaerales bacterium]
MNTLVDVTLRMDPFPSDAELLRRYAATGAGEDLTALVHRYVDLVYSAARRQLGDAHAAQDVTQQVFVVLLRKGRQLRAETVLASWLLKVTALECRNAKRGEARRVRRERKVAQMTPEVGAPPGGGGANDDADESGSHRWDELAPHLDAALGELSAGDREAVVMRYFLNRSYVEAAAVLGASEGSVRQRVHRGLGKIRAVLNARGMIATEAALTAALLAHAVESAPARVGAATIAAVGKAAGGAAGISTTGVFTIMAGTSPAKIGIVAGILLLAASITVLILANRGEGGRGSAVSGTSTTAPVVPALPVAGPTLVSTVAPEVTPAAVAPPAAKPRKLFDVITARTCDGRQGPRDGYDHIGFINRGDWVEYDNVEFPPADAPRALAFCAVVSCPAAYAGSDIQVHLVSPDGPLIATLTVEATAGYSDFVCQEALVDTNLSGPQDVFLVFTGGGFNIRSIKFTVIDGQAADRPIAATGYSMAKKVNEGGKVLINVRNGAWARYDCLQFPAAGADTFTLTYAVDASHAGGVISVRLDLPTAAPVCEIPIVATGGRMYLRTVALGRTVVGNHDVYLTFAGQDRGYQGLADVAWFAFNAPGTAKLTPPPPPPSTQATTRAATTGPTTVPSLRQFLGF